MLIKANQRFLDGRVEYRKDETYDVPRIEGTLFVRNGWAVEIDPATGEATAEPIVHQPLADPVDIEPDDAVHPSSVSV